MIRFEHVTKKYGNTVILDDLSFEIKEGEFAVLIGPSGCGKTTTLKSINRLIEPDAGHIYVNGKDIAETDPVKLRRSIGYVIQQIGLFPNMLFAIVSGSLLSVLWFCSKTVLHTNPSAVVPSKKMLALPAFVTFPSSGS